MFSKIFLCHGYSRGWSLGNLRKEKIYCITCDNLVRSKTDKCIAPENMKRCIENTWLRVYGSLKPELHPSVLNKNNDCKWYKQVRPSHDER